MYRRKGMLRHNKVSTCYGLSWFEFWNYCFSESIDNSKFNLQLPSKTILSLFLETSTNIPFHFNLFVQIEMHLNTTPEKYYTFLAFLFYPKCNKSWQLLIYGALILDQRYIKLTQYFNLYMQRYLNQPCSVMMNNLLSQR